MPACPVPVSGPDGSGGASAPLAPSPTTYPVQTTGIVVAIDPGHGGGETGAVARNGLAEKDVNLKIALKLARLLSDGGYRPVLTRERDREVNLAGADLNGDGRVNNDDDLQARVDIANAAHASILVSIHNNGSPHPADRGTRTYYCGHRPFAADNLRLASALQAHLVASIRAAGYDTPDMGISDDRILNKPFGHLFLLGPLTPRMARASNMPGALGETLYLTNPVEASLLARDDILTAIAQGYYQGIVAYLHTSR